MVLLASFLGWLFDGYEIGLFPVVARPALKSMLVTGGDSGIGQWMGIITASFLIGAACGGLIFGWLGDRIGRVRAMALSSALAVAPARPAAAQVPEPTRPGIAESPTSPSEPTTKPAFRGVELVSFPLDFGAPLTDVPVCSATNGKTIQPSNKEASVTRCDLVSREHEMGRAGLWIQL